MLKLEMLAAGHGDALLIEYGGGGETRRILVDGGPYYAYDDAGGLRERLHALLQEGKGTFELLVVTHVDTDHIDGVIRTLLDPELDGLVFKDVWFNGWKHVDPDIRSRLAGKHGAYLGALLEHLGLPWNAHPRLSGGAVLVPDEGPLPVLELEGGARITLLSPGPAELTNLKKDWASSVAEAGFTPGDSAAALEQVMHRARYGPPKDKLGTRPDHSAANGSSIAFFLEVGDERLLLAGDAWPKTLTRSLRRWTEAHDGAVPEVRDLKLSHHGSYGNQSKALIKSVRAGNYLISSSSAFFGHPDPDTIRLILKHHDRSGGQDPSFVFNYLSPSSKPWADPDDQAERGYTAGFPTGFEWVAPEDR